MAQTHRVVVMRIPLVAIFATLLPLTLTGQGEGAPQFHSVPVSESAFQQLRWLEGSWRGTGIYGTDQPTFYERYHFVDDSTLSMQGGRDSTFGTVGYSAEYQLRRSRVASAPPAPRWTLVALDSVTATFAPLEGAANTFTWHRKPDGSWVAVLRPLHPAARARLYRMVPLR